MDSIGDGRSKRSRKEPKTLKDKYSTWLVDKDTGSPRQKRGMDFCKSHNKHKRLQRGAVGGGANDFVERVRRKFSRCLGSKTKGEQGRRKSAGRGAEGLMKI